MKKKEIKPNARFLTKKEIKKLNRSLKISALLYGSGKMKVVK